jgi:signal transduction histidine kinase
MACMTRLRSRILLAFGIILALDLVGFAANIAGWNVSCLVLNAVEAVFLGISIVLLAREVVGPIEQLTASAREMRAGLRETVQVAKSGGEVSDLAISINDMAANEREMRFTDRERLVRAQEAVRTVIDSLPNAVALISPEGVIEIVNAAARRFGLDAGKDVRQIAQPWAVALVDEVRKTQTRVLGTQAGATVQVFDDGREYFFQPQGNPVLNPQGELIGITVLLLDMTDKQEVKEARDALLPSISHQIKTPMTSLQMSIHLLLEDTRNPPSPMQAELLRTAGDDANRLQRLIEEWLTDARMKR